MRTLFLSKEFVDQFETKILQKIVSDFMCLIHEFQLMIDNEEYEIKFYSNGDMRLGSNKKPTTSKVESILYNYYNNIEKKKELLLKFRDGFNYLNDIEKDIFRGLYIDGKTPEELCANLGLNIKKYYRYLKSTLVRFCVKLGLDKFSYIYKK